MTTDTLEAHKKAYRAGTITVRDQEAMLEELVNRDDRLPELRKKVEEVFDDWADDT